MTFTKLESLPLNDINNDTIERISQHFRPLIEDCDEVLNFLNERNVEKSLEQLSYDAYIKGLSGIKVDLPEYLIYNGLKVYFIPFSQVHDIQIERYIIDPILQPWADETHFASNKIITIFGKNGMTYLVKAKYDPVSHQIFSN